MRKKNKKVEFKEEDYTDDLDEEDEEEDEEEEETEIVDEKPKKKGGLTREEIHALAMWHQEKAFAYLRYLR